MSIASKIRFQKLCQVLENVKHAKPAKKIEILDVFFKQCRTLAQKLKSESPEADITLFPIMRLILPDLERERGPHCLKQTSLAKLYIDVFCLGKGSAKANRLTHYKTPRSRHFSGSDFAEIAYSVMRDRLPQTGDAFTVEQINKFLDDISKTGHSKAEMFKVLFRKVNALEFKWITRIVLKEMKLDIKKQKILQVFHRDANALLTVSDLYQVCEKLYDPKERYQQKIELFFHFDPMLLERCEIEDTAKLFEKGVQYFVQSKYDGERSQMHMKDGKYKYFTRRGHDITNNPSYGEDESSGFLTGAFSDCLNRDCKSIILDGELMVWHKRKKQFETKGANIEVKKLTKNSSYQPCFVAYDIILYNDELLVNKPYEERLEILKKALREREGAIALGASTKISTREELVAAFKECVRNKEEGIVVKKCDVIYRPNVRNGNSCYKIKAEYSDDLVEDIDLIVLGGYYGDGKKMGIINSFLLGVAEPPEIEGAKPVKFLSVVSVSSGISNELMEKLQERFKDLWVPKCPENVVPPKSGPPNVWIRPEDSSIFTIRATEITRSNVYPTKYSLRFPRVKADRIDKPWYTACTKTELLSLVKDARLVQKLTKKEESDDEIDEAPVAKARKVSRPPPVKLEEKPSKPNLYDNEIVPITRLFDGKEICVINGNDELSKERIEEILRQHRAKVVQNPISENCWIIIGKSKTRRAQGILNSRKYDVLTLDWLKRVTKEENWPSLQDFLPWDLICSRESTKKKLAQCYDEYYDSFTVDANEESLKRSFDKAAELGCDMDIDLEGMKEIDRELFDEISPYSIFRGIIGYFDDKLDTAKFSFRFMSGMVKESIDDSITHVFVKGDSASSATRNLVENEAGRSIKIVNSEWIEECVRKNALIPVSEYLFL